MSGISFGSLRQLFHASEPQSQAAREQPKPLTGMVPVAADARAAMQRSGEVSSRSRLIKHATLEKQRRSVAAMGRQWTQRAMGGRSATAPTAAPLSGFGAPAQQLLERHPMLCQQLAQLQAQGWTIGDQQAMREGDLRAHRHIALNPNMAKHQPAMFLSTLARHCGAAMHDGPLVLDSQQAFELGFLEREAAGALNVLALNDRQQASGKPLKLMVEAPMIRAYEALRAQSGGVTPTPAQMAAHVRDEFSRTGQLGMRASGQRRERLADDMQRQYQAFGIKKESSPADIDRVQRCFNHTGVAHSVSSLAAFGTNPIGISYWLDRKNLAGMLHQGAGGFTRLGIAESQIGPFIERALGEGQYIQLDDKHLAVTCYDHERDQAVPLYVTLGDKPGEISSVLACPLTSGYFVQGADGRQQWLNLAQLDQAQSGQAVQACATHGIEAQFMPEVIHTAMLKGRATALPPDPAKPGLTRTEYQFTYRHQPMSAVLHSVQGGNTVTGVEIKPRSATPTGAAAGPVVANIATRVDPQQWQQLAARAAGFELPPSALLERVAKPENMLMPSVEHPGFFQFRAKVAGQTVSLLARMENGSVVDARMPSEFDRILQSCPTQEEHLRSLQRQGWQISRSKNGEGMYCDSAKKRIALGEPSQIAGSKLFTVLVHEMAHARYSVPYDLSTEDAYAASGAANEGNSLLTEFEALEHFVAGPDRQRHLAELTRLPFFRPANQVYETMRQAQAQANDEQGRNHARLAAQTAMGQIYAGNTGSMDPDHVTYDMGWRSWYREHYGADPRSTRVARLAHEQPGLKVRGSSGLLEAPGMGNIEHIKALPRRPDGPMGKGPGQLFVTSATLLEQSQGHDLRVFQNVVASAVNHCDPQIEPIGTNAEQLTYRFNRQNQSHQVTMRLGSTGQVLSIQHATAPLQQAPTVVGSPATATTS